MVAPASISLARSRKTTAAGYRPDTVLSKARVWGVLRRSCRWRRKRTPSTWTLSSSASPRYLVKELLPEP